MFDRPASASFAVLFSILLSKISAATGKIISRVEDLQPQYDFVIVGGGTAGCVLANRLSVNPKHKVLVIEAGGSHEGIENMVIPFLGSTLAGTSLDWNYTSTPQATLNGRSIPYSRGQVLGGSSSTNLLTWNRGSNDLWDEWAKITQDPGWSWNAVRKFYLKVSRMVPPVDGHDTTGEYVPSAHGNGPVEVTLPNFPTELDDKVISASKELGGRFGYTVDINAGVSVGFSAVQTSAGRGKRSSSATAYLNPVLSRPNLDVLLRTLATKIQPSSPSGKELKLNVVEIANISEPSGPRRLITASKEVILSAGAINTPQLLLLSGIGPLSTLTTHGIQPVLISPSVGQNLTDHPQIANYFSVNPNATTYDALLRDPVLFNAALEEYRATGKGLFSNSRANRQGYLRLPKTSSLLKKFGDPSSGVGSGHIEFIFADGFGPVPNFPPPATGKFMTIRTAVVSPTSRGYLTLASNNPFDKPLINPALLSTEFDIATAVQSVKDLDSFLAASPWTGFITSPFGDLANATTDELKVAYVRKYALSFFHPVGTAAMSPVNANWGVVDPDLRVKGVKGLRIVDASIFPVIPECHPQALVYIIAERISDLIVKRYG